MYKNLLVIALATLFFYSGCASSNQMSELEATRAGFTDEIDEPAVRGRLIRVTDDQIDIRYGFTLTKDFSQIVLSGIDVGSNSNRIHLWRIDANDTGAPVRLTSGGTGHNLSPSFTSNGEYIVFENNGNLWKVNKDGSGGLISLRGTGGHDYAPNVSSTDKIVFTSYHVSGANAGRSFIWTSELDGGNLRQLREGTYPKWSPDSESIAFSHNGNIYTISYSGSNLRQLTSDSDHRDGLPSFSPDGNFIYYTSNAGGAFNIWRMTAEGRNREQLTTLDSWDSWPLISFDGVYFLSGRAQNDNRRITRLWKLNNN